MDIKIIEIIGFSFFGSGIIWLLIEGLVWWRISVKSTGRKRFRFKEMTALALFYGGIEISMFSFAFMRDAPEFIFLWIGVKTALRWDRKRKEKEDIPDKHEQRGTYYSFLIGSALSIIISYCIASYICKEFPFL